MKEEKSFPTNQPCSDMPQSETTPDDDGVTNSSAPIQSPAAVGFGLDKLEELNDGLAELEEAYQLNLLKLDKDSADYQLSYKRVTASFTTKKSEMRRKFGIFLRNKGNHRTSNGVAVNKVKRNTPKDETLLQRGRDIMGMNDHGPEDLTELPSTSLGTDDQKKRTLKRQSLDRESRAAKRAKNKNESIPSWVFQTAADVVDGGGDHVMEELPPTSVNSPDYERLITAQSVDRKTRAQFGKETDVALMKTGSVGVDFTDAKNIKELKNYTNNLTSEKVKTTKRGNKTKLSTNNKKHKASRTSKSFKTSTTKAVNMSSSFQPDRREEKARSSNTANVKKGSSGVKDEDVLENKPSSINRKPGAARPGSSLSSVRQSSSSDDDLSAFSAWMPMGHAIHILRFDEKEDEYAIQAEGKDKIHKITPEYILYWVSERELERFERYGPFVKESSDEESSESESESESDIENIPSLTVKSRQGWEQQRAIELEKSHERMRLKRERALDPNYKPVAPDPSKRVLLVEKPPAYSDSAPKYPWGSSDSESSSSESESTTAAIKPSIGN